MPKKVSVFIAFAKMLLLGPPRQLESTTLFYDAFGWLFIWCLYACLLGFRVLYAWIIMLM